MSLKIENASDKIKHLFERVASDAGRPGDEARCGTGGAKLSVPGV